MNVLASEKSQSGKPRGVFALGRSYASDLRRWAVKLAAGYGIAAALLLGGILAVFGAIAVGAVALFHFIDLRYGPDIAFAALGSGLLLLAAILLRPLLVLTLGGLARGLPLLSALRLALLLALLLSLHALLRLPLHVMPALGLTARRGLRVLGRTAALLFSAWHVLG